MEQRPVPHCPPPPPPSCGVGWPQSLVPEGLRPYSPGRPPRCRDTRVSAKAAGSGPRVWLLWVSTSSRSTFPPLVTADTGSLWMGGGAPSPAVWGGLLAGCVAQTLKSPASGLQLPPSGFLPSPLQKVREGPAHLPAGATVHHTVPQGMSPMWRTDQHRRRPAAGPGAGGGQECPAEPRPTPRHSPHTAYLLVQHLQL